MQYANSNDAIIDNLDAELIKTLTKEQMQEFYNHYLHPSSKARARLSIHLHARGAEERETKTIEALTKAGFTDVPVEKRQSVEELEAYLKASDKASSTDVDALVSQIKELGLTQKPLPIEANTATNGACAVDAAVEITDVRSFKAGLAASSGPRPYADITSFEETDPKL